MVTTTQHALHRKPSSVPICRCSTCKYSLKDEYIEDQRGTRFRLLPLQCQAKNCVYVINCSLCKMKYVGMTTKMMKQRMAQHVSSIINHKSTSISAHFNSPNHNMSHFKVALLDINVFNRLDLRMREGFWIRTLQTTSRGINKREESTNIIDYQLFSIINHFRHSKTCFPYCTFNIDSMETLQLQTFRRTLIPRRKRPRSLHRTSTSTERQ